MKNPAIVILLLIPSISFAQLNTLTTAVPFLLITPDARAGAMGDAGCASTPNVFSSHWNASKLAFIENNNGISFSYAPWLRAYVPGINLFDMTSYKKIGRYGVLGLAVKYFRSAEMDVFPLCGGACDGAFQPYDYSGSVSYSIKLSDNFSMGATGKYIYSNLPEVLIVPGLVAHPGRSFAGDISCFWRDTLKLKEMTSLFSWGVNMQNIGQKISYSNQGNKDFLPQNMRIGLAYRMILDKWNSIELVCDANKLLVPSPQPCDTTTTCQQPDKTVFYALYSSFYDASGGFKEELQEVNIASGLEYWHNQTVAVRTGYFYEHETKGGRKYFTAGIGLRYKGVELDGSYLVSVEQNHPLRKTWRVSLSCEFDRFRKRKD